VAYGIGIKIDDFNQADVFKRDLDRALDYNYLTVTWTFLRRNFYQALGTEKTLIGVVLFFLIAMAAFSIASTLIMVVMEKEREIGILKSVGMQTAAIMRVFIAQGFIIGMVGTLIGMFTGLFIASAMDNLLRLIEDGVNLFRNGYHAVFGALFSLPTPHPWKLFPQDVYYVSTFPIEINVVEVYAICLGSVLLTTLCAFIPANQAARLKVTEVLHKE
jgi:lipoprotein-releasing system permease protein